MTRNKANIIQGLDKMLGKGVNTKVIERRILLRKRNSVFVVNEIRTYYEEKGFVVRDIKREGIYYYFSVERKKEFQNA